jgi:hypothetical protein
VRAAALALCVGCAAVSPAAAPAANVPPTRADLDAVTERGVALASFDKAAAGGTDAVFMLHPDQSLLSHYIAVKTDSGWVTKFGKIEGSVFKVAYEARLTLEGYKADAIVPPREEAGFTLTAARAVDLTAARLRGDHPYNVAELPAGGGRVFVYAYPAPTEKDPLPFGADFRWLVSADGTEILEERRMHNGLISSSDRPANAVSQAHTHVLREGVEDTDVMHAIQSRLMQHVLTPSGAFVIVDPDGRITWASPEDARKRFGGRN